MPNLADTSCLSVLTMDNTPEEISLRNLVENPQRYRCLHLYSPLAETATLTTLAALFADAVNLDLPNESADERYIVAQRAPDEVADAVIAYLDEHYDKFELDPSLTTIPFMQSRDAITTGTDKGYMLAEYGSVERQLPLPPSTVIGNLLATNLASLGGITTPAVGDPRLGGSKDSKGNLKPAVQGGKFYGTPVCPQSVHQTFLALRTTLFDTIRANISKSMVGDFAGTPYWRMSEEQRPDAYGTGGSTVDTVLYYLTAPYRMIRLVFNGDGRVVSATSTPGAVHPGLGSDETRRLAREFSPYAVVSMRKDTPTLVNPNPSGELSDLKTFLMEPATPSGKLALPAVLSDILSLDDDGDDGDALTEMFKDIRVRSLTTATDSKATKYTEVSPVEVAFDIRSLNTPATASTFALAITTAAEARTFYMHAVSDVTLNMSRTETQSANKFEGILSPLLRKFVASIHPDSDLVEKEQEWQNLLKTTAATAFDSFAMSLPRSALRIYTGPALTHDKVVPKTVSAARGRFLYRVNGLFVAPDTDPKPKKGKK